MMNETHYCIICGEPFDTDDPKVALCSKHAGVRADKPEVQKPEVITPIIQVVPQNAHSPFVANVEWTAGQVILDTYEVKGELGKGGFGRVYRVHHKAWNMDLAVKRALNLDEQGKQAFIDEAQKWIDLGLHPHIISCFYVRNIDGFPHTFAELAEGGSLESWIQRGRYDLYAGDSQAVLSRILDIAIQFAWGLGYAHEHGLVHQDVKPGNALMTPDGTLKVTDFGLARARGNPAPGTSPVSGGENLVDNAGYTLAYRSPEQTEGKKLSLATDIWSWAVSVLEMFYGGRSWLDGQRAADTLKSYLQHAGEEEDIPPMPDAVTDLLRECFQSDPQARPKDMLEITDRLIAIYQQEIGQSYSRDIPKPSDLKADSLNNKALSMLDLGKPAEAEAYLEQAIATDGQHVEATYNLGLLRWRSGQASDVDVLQKLQQIQQDKPGDGGLASGLGWVCLESGRFSEALAYFEQSGRLGGDPTSVEGLKLAKPLVESGAGACLRTFEGHEIDVSSVAISPDGRTALSGSYDNSLKLWDLATGKCLHTFVGHKMGVIAIAISPDGYQALSGSDDQTLRLWDLVGGRCLRTFVGDWHIVNSVAFTPDGRMALSGSSNEKLKLWDLVGGECLRTFGHQTGRVDSVAISPDGCQALSGGHDKKLNLWDLTTGACLRSFEGHRHLVNSIAFSPDGCQALSGSWDRTLKLWDLATGACLRTLEGHTDFVHSVAISSDGRYALSGSEDKTLKLWNLEEGVCLRTFEGHTSRVISYTLSPDGRYNLIGRVSSVAFTPDGQWALSGSGDATLKLWDLVWVEENHYTAPLRYARGLAGSEAASQEGEYALFLAQGRQLLLQGQVVKALACLESARALPGFERTSGTLALSASLSTRARIKGFREGWLSQNLIGHTGIVFSVAFSPDGCFALSGSYDESLKLWDLSRGDCLRTLNGHTSTVIFADFSPDGRQALSSSYGEMFKLWDLKGGECLRTLVGNTSGLSSFAISPDGRKALSSGRDDKFEVLILWDLARGVRLRTFEGHSKDVNSIVFSPDDHWAISGGEDKTLKLWDLARGVCLRTYKGHKEYVSSVTISPDGRSVLSGSGDKTLKLWGLMSGKCIRTFEGHTSRVNTVAISPDGRWALSGSDDTTLKLWNLAKGVCLRTFEGHVEGVKSVAFSHDGHQFLSGDANNTIKLWNLAWNYEFPCWVDWDKGAIAYLETFLSLHTPFAGQLLQDRAPTKNKNQLSRTYQGKPTWTEEDFQGLLTELGYRGYGWLREEGVRRKLEEMARERG